MANNLVQFRMDDALKIKASEICEQLGIDLPTYYRMCTVRMIQENGIPFSTKLDRAEDNRGLSAMKAASMLAKEKGISDMSLEEINIEINEARKGRK